jgi:AcrR family transcriptional regulator
VTRNTLDDVVEAAGRLFGERGFHGTSMRDLGAELGLLGSSLYSHVGSKQELLLAVIEKGSRFFEASAVRDEAVEGSGSERVAAFVRGISMSSSTTVPRCGPFSTRRSSSSPMSEPVPLSCGIGTRSASER